MLKPKNKIHDKICRDVAALQVKLHYLKKTYPTGYVDILKNPKYTVHNKTSLLEIRSKYKDYIKLLFKTALDENKRGGRGD